MSEYGLVLAFDVDDSQFVRGFEAGDVFQLARRFAEGEQIHEDDPPDAFVQTVHATNAEMMLRVAECHGLTVRSEEAGDGWIHVTFARTERTERTEAQA